MPCTCRRDGIKVAISFVIAIINSILVTTLRISKFYIERHWTVTRTELRCGATQRAGSCSKEI